MKYLVRSWLKQKKDKAMVPTVRDERDKIHNTLMDVNYQFLKFDSDLYSNLENVLNEDI